MSHRIYKKTYVIFLYIAVECATVVCCVLNDSPNALNTHTHTLTPASATTFKAIAQLRVFLHLSRFVCAPAQEICFLCLMRGARTIPHSCAFFSRPFQTLVGFGCLMRSLCVFPLFTFHLAWMFGRALQQMRTFSLAIFFLSLTWRISVGGLRARASVCVWVCVFDGLRWLYTIHINIRLMHFTQFSPKRDY